MGSNISICLRVGYPPKTSKRKVNYGKHSPTICVTMVQSEKIAGCTNPMSMVNTVIKDTLDISNTVLVTIEKMRGYQDSTLVGTEKRSKRSKRILTAQRKDLRNRGKRTKCKQQAVF